jgi:hypothetical protein
MHALCTARLKYVTGVPSAPGWNRKIKQEKRTSGSCGSWQIQHLTPVASMLEHLRFLQAARNHS